MHWSDDMSGKIYEIYLAERDKAPTSLVCVEVEAGKGIVGDRYHKSEGTFSHKLANNPKSQITFIASEEVDRFNQETGEKLGYGEPRRNLVTRGIDLESLIGRQFSIGSARFRGIERCEPCTHLAATVNEKVLPHLIHTGLRAEVLQSGVLTVGDELQMTTDK